MMANITKQKVWQKVKYQQNIAKQTQTDPRQLINIAQATPPTQK